MNEQIQLRNIGTNELDLSALLKNVKSKSASIQARTNYNNIIKPPPGKSRWRVLPGWRANEPAQFYHEFAQHWIKEPNPTGGDPLLKGIIVCEDKTFGKPCDCCDQINTIKTGMKAAGLTKEAPTWKQIDEMRGKLAYLLNVLRRDGDQKSDEPKMLGLPETAFTAFLTKFTTRAEEGVNMLDLTTGFDIVITRTGTGLNTEYDVDVAVAPSAVPADVMTKLINIDAFIEAERQKGVNKVSALGAAAKAVLANGGAHSTLMIPSAASLVPAARPAPSPSRVIENDEVPFTEQATVSPASVSVPAQSVAQAPVAAVTSAPVSSQLLEDDELQALLANL